MASTSTSQHHTKHHNHHHNNHHGHGHGPKAAHPHPPHHSHSHHKTSKKEILLLTAPVYTEEWNGETLHVSSLTGYPYHRTIEFAGLAYHQFVITKLKHLHGEGHLNPANGASSSSSQSGGGKKKSKAEKKSAAINAAATAAAAEEEDPANMDDAMRAKMHAKRKLAMATEDWYEILGLGSLRWKANQTQIKNAYRKACLEHHPDKNMDVTEDGSPDDTMFKLVTKAYEVLGDDKKRSAYDSAEAFDDVIPSDLPEGADFFTFFSSQFTKWSRWSGKSPIPELGTASSGWEAVDKFYQFWSTFRSTRDFSYQDEYDSNTAETREEKRWIERNNEKKREKLKKEEKAKIMKLVELAQRKDPRVKKRKAHLEKERLKKELKSSTEGDRKLLAQVKREAERQSKLDEEEKLKREEKAAAAAIKNKERLIVAAQKKRLRDLCSPYVIMPMSGVSRSKNNAVEEAPVGIDAVAIEVLLARLAHEELQLLCDKLEAVKLSFPDFHDIFDEVHEQHKPKTALPHEKPKPKANKNSISMSAFASPSPSTSAAAAAATTPSTPDTTTTAASPAQPHSPSQTPAPTSTATPAAAATEEATTTATSTPVAAEEAAPAREWTNPELSLLAKAIAKYPGGTSQRWKMISELVGTRTAEEVQLKTAELRKLDTAKSVHRSTDQYFDDFIHKTMADKEKKVGANVEAIVGEATLRFDSPASLHSHHHHHHKKHPEQEATPATATAPTATPTATATPAPTTATATAVEGPHGWSLDQQKALETGLRAHTAKDAERWSKIALSVPGKSKEECQERFNYLVAQLKAKQAQIKKN